MEKVYVKSCPSCHLAAFVPYAAFHVLHSKQSAISVKSVARQIR